MKTKDTKNLETGIFDKDFIDTMMAETIDDDPISDEDLAMQFAKERGIRGLNRWKSIFKERKIDVFKTHERDGYRGGSSSWKGEFSSPISDKRKYLTQYSEGDIATVTLKPSPTISDTEYIIESDDWSGLVVLTVCLSEKVKSDLESIIKKDRLKEKNERKEKRIKLSRLESDLQLKILRTCKSLENKDFSLEFDEKKAWYPGENSEDIYLIIESENTRLEISSLEIRRNINCDIKEKFILSTEGEDKVEYKYEYSKSGDWWELGPGGGSELVIDETEKGTNVSYDKLIYFTLSNIPTKYRRFKKIGKKVYYFVN